MTVSTTELRDAARQVVDDLGLAADEQDTWALVAELGWLVLEMPEADSGLGLDLADACALHVELGRGLARVPFIAALLAIDTVVQSELPERADLLASLGSGDRYIGVPLAETEVQYVGGKLDGVAHGVPAADRSREVLLWSGANDCIALVAIDAPGLQLECNNTWDETRRLFDLHLEDVVPTCILARGDAAHALLRRLRMRRDFALAAEAVGGATSILERTVAYLGERQQFGRPLAMFQALKHRCADLKSQVEAATALLEAGLAQTASAHDCAAAERAGLAAKLLANNTYTHVVEEALQLHGGIGMTSEHDCHLFLKRAMLDEHLGRGRDAYARMLAGGSLYDT